MEGLGYSALDYLKSSVHCTLNSKWSVTYYSINHLKKMLLSHPEGMSEGSQGLRPYLADTPGNV